MSASRHTYGVVCNSAVVKIDGEYATALALIWNGSVPAVFGSQAKADAYCAEIKDCFPEIDYRVIKLR